MAAAVNLIETLPTEVLERIFSYCTYEDILQSVQNVCSQWRQVAQSSRVWKHLIYCPKMDTSSEQIVKMLKISPKLQNLILKMEYGASVLRAITENCGELKKLQMIRQWHVNLKFMRDLQEKCPKIEYLSVGFRCLENEIYMGVEKFTNLKVLIWTADVCTLAISLRPFGEYCKRLEHFEFRCYNFEMNDFRHFLFMRKETLHTLGVNCCNISGECVLPDVSVCKLKSLSLFAYGSCKRQETKIKHFGQLKTLRALTIEDLLDEELDVIRKIFETENMSQLKKLSLYNLWNFVDEITDVILNNCPMLQTLTLERCEDMTDASLMTIRNFKELTSLNISCNYMLNSGFLHLRDLPLLKCLRIANCCRLSKQGFDGIAELSKLQELKLREQNLAEFPWNIIPCQMKYLRYLGIYACGNVDRCAIEKLKMQLLAVNVICEETEQSDFITDFRWEDFF